MSTLTDTPQESCIWFARRTGQGYSHNWISNFHVEDNGLSIEHLFQAAKHDGHPIRQTIILNAKTPGKAKKLGRKWKLDEHELAAWNAHKIDVMLALVNDKLYRNLDMRDELVHLEGPIIEENDWHDNFWGNCICPKCRGIRGDNYLGKLYEMARHRWRGILT